MLIAKTHFDFLASNLSEETIHSGLMHRMEANLDGLRIEHLAATALAKERLLDPTDPDDLSAAGLVLVECGDRDDAKLVVNKLLDSEVENCDAIRRGLRLAPIGKIWDELVKVFASAKAIPKAAILDVLAFHRTEQPCELRELAMNEAPMVRRCVAEAAGRFGDNSKLALLRLMIEDADPEVQKSALRSCARVALPSLGDICRTRSVADVPCLESIRFLAVVGTDADFGLLTQLTKNKSTAFAALKAMGGIGTLRMVQSLISLLADPVLGDAAATALERIIAFSVPRGAPPEPPPDATEEELDFWNPPSPPIPKAAEAWWNEHQSKFHDGKRYQAGICVSENPLGDQFDQLPDEVRFDLYLRERSNGNESVPDWELKTWPHHQRNPRWAIGKG